MKSFVALYVALQITNLRCFVCHLASNFKQEKMRMEIEALKQVAKTIGSPFAAAGTDANIFPEKVDPVKVYTEMRFNAAPLQKASTRIAMSSSSSSSSSAAATATIRSRPQTGGPRHVDNSLQLPNKPPSYTSSPSVSNHYVSSAQVSSSGVVPESSPLPRFDPSLPATAAAVGGGGAAAAAAAVRSSRSPVRRRPSTSSSHLTPTALRSRPSSSSHLTPSSASSSLVARPSSSHNLFRSSTSVSGRHATRSFSRSSRDRSASASRDGAAGYASSHDLR
jgi:hypothetical protein